jgi:hypothetical protein
MLMFGTLFIAVALLSSLIRTAIPGAKIFCDVPVPAGECSRQFAQIGFALLLVAGALSAGAFIAVASFLAHQQDLLSAWLTIAGYVVAVLQFAAVLFLPFVLLPLWVLVSSIIVLIRQQRVASPARPVAIAEGG